MARNVEIKARLSDYEDTARRARELSPSEPVVIAQEDVFFPCPSGRLKLRILGPEQGELIFYQRPDHEIAEHYRVVGAAADLPLFVYNLPGSTGVDITPELMQMIQDKVPQLAGLKHSSQVFPNVRIFAKMGLCCLIGSNQLMLPAMTYGATGCVDGPPILAPERWVAIWQAYQDGDIKRAEAAQDEASNVIEVLRACGGGFHATMKFAVSERLGIDCGDPRPPGLPLTEEQRTAISKALETLELI